jgi:hypothetical protein
MTRGRHLTSCATAIATGVIINLVVVAVLLLVVAAPKGASPSVDTDSCKVFSKRWFGNEAWTIGSLSWIEGTSPAEERGLTLSAAALRLEYQRAVGSGRPLDLPSAIPSWISLWDDRQPNDQIRQVVATGWPAKCLALTVSTSKQGVTRHQSVILPFVPHRRRLPSVPIWAGLLANTLVYATVTLLVAQATRTVQRARRRRGGHCPSCGYDLQFRFDVGCAECGWNKPVTGRESGLCATPADRASGRR